MWLGFEASLHPFLWNRFGRYCVNINCLKVSIYLSSREPNKPENVINFQMGYWLAEGIRNKCENRARPDDGSEMHFPWKYWHTMNRWLLREWKWLLVEKWMRTRKHLSIYYFWRKKEIIYRWKIYEKKWIHSCLQVDHWWIEEEYAQQFYRFIKPSRYSKECIPRSGGDIQ